MTETTRIVEFAVDAVVDSDMTIRVFKTVTVKITVTKPDKDGYFSITTQLGEETPTRVEISVNNKKIVKDVE